MKLLQPYQHAQDFDLCSAHKLVGNLIVFSRTRLESVEAMQDTKISDFFIRKSN